MELEHVAGTRDMSKRRYLSLRLRRMHVCRSGEHLHSIEAILSTPTLSRIRAGQSGARMRTPPSRFASQHQRGVGMEAET